MYNIGNLTFKGEKKNPRTVILAITDAETLESLSDIIDNKQDNISDLETIREGASKGATALLEESDPIFKASVAANITSNNIENWNNKGTYSKPTEGIPVGDLENTVLVSLGLANTALQSESDPTVPDWAKAETKPSYSTSELTDWDTATSNFLTSDANYAKLNTANTFTLGQTITRSTEGAILALESAAANTNFTLTRTNCSTCVLESGGSVGLFGTYSNHPLLVRTNYTNRMTFGTDGSVTLASDVATNSNSNQVATTKWVTAKGYLTSYTEQYQGTVKSVNNTNPDADGNVTISIPTVTNDFTDTYKNRLDTLTDTYIKSLIENGNEEEY